MFSVLIVNVVRTRVFKIRVDEAVDLVGRDGDRRLWHRPVCRHVCLLVRVYPVCVMCAKGEDDELPCAPKVEPNLDNTTWESPSHRAATKLWRGIGGELSENESFDARTFHISSHLILSGCGFVIPERFPHSSSILALIGLGHTCLLSFMDNLISEIIHISHVPS